MTRREIDAIKDHWRYFHRLQLRSDGCLWAQRQPGGAWGVLLTRRQVDEELARIRSTAKEPKP